MRFQPGSCADLPRDDRQGGPETQPRRLRERLSRLLGAIVSPLLRLLADSGAIEECRRELSF